MKHLHLHSLLLSCISLLRCAVVPAADGGRRREARALLKWKASLGGGDTYLSSWTANSSGPCSWDFITCDSAGDVTGLNITGTDASQDLDAGLRGTLAALDFSPFPRLNTLQLSQNNLYGAIPEGIGNLTSLVSLNISFDFLTGPIPRSIGQLERLRVLALQFLLLQGRIPDEIGNLTSLELLQLTHNALTGSVIPPAAAASSSSSRLGKLTWLGLSQNSLSGGIPLEIGNMSELRGMDLGYNLNLEGPLPSTLSGLGRLRYLLLSNNRFGGDLASSQLGSNNSNLLQIDVESNDFSRMSARSICAGGALEDFRGNSNSFGSVQDLDFFNCTSLVSLQLGHNSILGDISELLGKLPKQTIREVYFSQNQLGGTLPLELGEFVRLRSLGLHGNRITGEIPPTLGNITGLAYLDLGKNLLTGTVPPELGKLVDMISLDLGYNHLPGPLPLTLSNLSKLVSLDLSNCGLQVHSYDLFTHEDSTSSSNISFPEIVVLALSSNHITGTIPTPVCNAKRLEILDLSTNGLYGDLPDCLWGIPLRFMDLSSNSFHGVLPPWPTSSSITLQSLHLANNHFEGDFPSIIKKCDNLITLDLASNSFTGEIPSWIAQSSPQLRFLRLSSNMFAGTIPSQIVQLGKLQLLDLSNNKLAGPVSVDFENFTGMTQEQSSGVIIIYDYSYLEQIQLVWKNQAYEYSIPFVTGIDLSCNFLSQAIPRGITTLHGLRSLNLSRNNFSGNIPRDIGNLALLESLDLSWNHLNGEIPLSLADLKALSTLNLSNNGLSGRIPTGSQLQTLDYPSIYSNNPGLCGFPLKECANNASVPTQNETSNVVDRETLWFYCFVVAGFIFGFWLSLCVLFCKEKWRYALQQHVDNMQEKVANKIAAHCRSRARR